MEQGNGDNRIFSCSSLQIYFHRISKRHKVTEVNNCQLDDTIQIVDRPNTTPVGQDNLRKL